MQLFSRFPIIVWFIIIALLTSASVSYYTYARLFDKQIESAKQAELERIKQRLSQLQGTINDFNRRQNYNAIHREVSRLSSDPSMEFILIVDEHGIIKYSSSIELRDTPVAGLPEINKYTLDINHRSGSGLSQISADGNYIIGIYPLEYISHPESYSKRDHSYLFARFDLIQTLNLLRYRQQQEIVQTTIIHFGMLLTGFLLLYLGMRNRIKSIISGIRLFSEGDYSTRIHLFGQDEFSKISRGFDDMAVKLQTQNQNLLDLTDQLWAQHEELVLQEQDLRVTLNSIGDAVIATNADGLITRMNPVAQKLSGWNISDATGRPITEVFRIIDASTRQPIENPIEKVIKTGETVYLSNNTTLISRDGSEYQISDSAAPIRDEDNIIQGMVLIFNDVTEQYRLRNAVANNEALLRSIMNNSPAVIYVKNIDNKLSFINQRFLNTFHLYQEAINDKTLHDILPTNIADILHANDKNVISTGNILEVEETLSLNNDSHIFSSIKFPLTDKTGKIYAICAISTDITERKQQEQLLRRSQKMDALGKLTGGIAHDYNNMLGVIMGYSELLEQALINEPKLHKYASEIHHAGKRGANLTQKLLAFSRPKQSENQQVNINNLLTDRKDMLQKVLTARIKLDMALDNAIWPVWINSGDLEDAIVNISINAMHAMPEGGRLTISTSNVFFDELDAQNMQINPGDYIQVSFTDTGIGMDKETQEKMFDPFFSSKGDMGAGLGLSQVYGLVNSNSGTIKVYSEPGHGTRISIYLPRCIEDVSDTHTNKLMNQKTEIFQGSETILIVDDEPALRQLTEEILSQHGYHVLTADSGQAAQIVLKDKSVDILFSDIIMPDMSGYELASWVRQNYPNIKIQLASGFNNNRPGKTLNKNLDLKILHKPFSSKELLQAIKQLSQSTITADE